MAFLDSDQSLQIVIKAKNEASKVLESVEKNVKSFKGSVEKMQPAFQKMALVGGVAFAGISVGIKNVVGESVKLGESINAVNVIFGDGAETITKFGESAARAVGLSNAEFNQLAANTGAVLKATGKEMGVVADMTTELSIRAADMASVYNTDVQTAMNAIRSGLIGQSEPLRSLGVIMSETEVQAFALASGIIETDRAMTEQEKVLARYNFIMEQSKVVSGDFANTSGSLANQQRILSSQFKDIAAKLGQEIVPIIQKLITKVTPLIESFAKWVEENPKLAAGIIAAVAALAGLVAVVGTLGLLLPAIITGFVALTGPIGIIGAIIGGLIFVGYQLVSNWETIKWAAGAVWDWIADKFRVVAETIKTAFEILGLFFKTWWDLNVGVIKTALALIVGLISMFLEWLFPSWKENLSEMGKVWQEGWNDFASKVSEIMGVIQEVVGTAFAVVGGVVSGWLGKIKELWLFTWSAMTDFFVGIWQPVKDTFGGVINYIIENIEKAIELYNNLKSLVSKPIQSAVSGVGDFFNNAISQGRSILGFEHGGVVPGAVGEAVPILAHGQETILPAGKSAGTGSFTVVIQNPQFSSREDETRMRRFLDDYFRPLMANHKIGT